MIIMTPMSMGSNVEALEDCDPHDHDSDPLIICNLTTSSVETREWAALLRLSEIKSGQKAMKSSQKSDLCNLLTLSQRVSKCRSDQT
jgi:hypothetical protein